MGVILFQFILAFLLLGGYYLIRKKEKKNIVDTSNSTSERISKLQIPNERFSLYGNIGSNHAILSDKDELFIISSDCSNYDKINYSDILDVKMDIHIEEKNSRRIIAFTSTYDKSVKINRVDLKIITGYKTYTIYYTPGANTPKGFYNGSLGNKIDDTERFKLLIESKMNKIVNN